MRYLRFFLQSSIFSQWFFVLWRFLFPERSDYVFPSNHGELLRMNMMGIVRSGVLNRVNFVK